MANILERLVPIVLQDDSTPDRMEFSSRGQVSMEIGYSYALGECYLNVLSAITETKFIEIQEMRKFGMSLPAPVAMRRITGIPGLKDIRDRIDQIIRFAESRATEEGR